jgi:hypothetical protein
MSLALKGHDNPPPAAIVLRFQREAWWGDPGPRALPLLFAHIFPPSRRDDWSLADFFNILAQAIGDFKK